MAGLKRGWPAAGEINIVLLGPRAMAALNWDFLQHEGTTDVITFDLRPAPGDPVLEGAPMAEIYVCPRVAAEAAMRLGTSPSRELVLYMVHGLLHLAGYDDQTPEDAARMRKAEARVLKALGRDTDLDQFL